MCVCVFIFYFFVFKVTHLEPWERNSRKLAGQVGMCAGVSPPFFLQEWAFTIIATHLNSCFDLNHIKNGSINFFSTGYLARRRLIE